MKIRKGDNVIIISGKDKGKTGKVLKALPQQDRVIVEDVNVLKKHQRPQHQNQQGQIINRAMPIHVSNVMLADQKGGGRSRVGYKMKENKKIRIAKKSGTELAS